MKKLLLFTSIFFIVGCKGSNPTNNEIYETYRLELGNPETSVQSVDLGSIRDIDNVRRYKINISNISPEDSMVGVPTLSSSDGYSLSGENKCLNLAPGKSCSLIVQFNPAGRSTAIYESQLIFGSVSPMEVNFSINLTVYEGDTNGIVISKNGGSSQIAVNGNPDEIAFVDRRQVQAWIAISKTQPGEFSTKESISISNQTLNGNPVSDKFLMFDEGHDRCSQENIKLGQKCLFAIVFDARNSEEGIYEAQINYGIFSATLRSVVGNNPFCTLANAGDNGVNILNVTSVQGLIPNCQVQSCEPTYIPSGDNLSCIAEVQFIAPATLTDAIEVGSFLKINSSSEPSPSTVDKIFFLASIGTEDYLERTLLTNASNNFKGLTQLWVSDGTVNGTRQFSKTATNHTRPVIKNNKVIDAVSIQSTPILISYDINTEPLVTNTLASSIPLCSVSPTANPCALIKGVSGETGVIQGDQRSPVDGITTYRIINNTLKKVTYYLVNEDLSLTKYSEVDSPLLPSVNSIGLSPINVIRDQDEIFFLESNGYDVDGTLFRSQFYNLKKIDLSQPIQDYQEPVDPCHLETTNPCYVKQGITGVRARATFPTSLSEPIITGFLGENKEYLSYVGKCSGDTVNDQPGGVCILRRNPTVSQYINDPNVKIKVVGNSTNSSFINMEGKSVRKNGYDYFATGMRLDVNSVITGVGSIPTPFFSSPKCSGTSINPCGFITQNYNVPSNPQTGTSYEHFIDTNGDLIGVITSDSYIVHNTLTNTSVEKTLSELSSDRERPGHTVSLTNLKRNGNKQFYTVNEDIEGTIFSFGYEINLDQIFNTTIPLKRTVSGEEFRSTARAQYVGSIGSRAIFNTAKDYVSTRQRFDEICTTNLYGSVVGSSWVTSPQYTQFCTGTNPQLYFSPTFGIQFNRDIDFMLDSCLTNVSPSANELTAAGGDDSLARQRICVNSWVFFNSTQTGQVLTISDFEE